jgi:hypothetical protein
MSPSQPFCRSISRNPERCASPKIVATGNSDVLVISPALGQFPSISSPQQYQQRENLKKLAESIVSRSNRPD